MAQLPPPRPVGPPPPPGPPPPSGPRPSDRRGLVIGLVVGAVVLALVAAVLIVLLATGSDDEADSERSRRRSTPPTSTGATASSTASPGSTATDSASGTAATVNVSDADRAAAIAFGNDAATTILSYSYRELDQYQSRAQELMTDGFAREWSTTFESLEDMAAQSKAVVSAQPVHVGLAGIDETTARVVVFVNQTSTRAGKSEAVTASTAVLTLHKDGEDWLVDDLATEHPPATPTEPDPERQAVLDAATTAAAALVNIDYRTIDADVQKVLDLSTGDFKRQYSDSLDDLLEAVREATSVMTGTVTVAGLETYAPDRATVLVATTGSVTNSSTGDSAAERRNRLQMELTRVDDAWLVSDLQYVS